MVYKPWMEHKQMTLITSCTYITPTKHAATEPIKILSPPICALIV